MGLDFSLGDEQRMLKDSVRSIFRRFEGRRAELREMIIKRREFPREMWEAIAEGGFLGCVIPPEYGGTGMGLLASTFVVEEMGKMGFGNAVLILTTMDAVCIERNGTEELKRRFLPKMASGELKFCFALTEANAGSNTFRLETTAERQGDSYVINGSKTFITGVDVTDYMLLVTRTKSLKQCQEEGLPKAYGLSLFIVDTRSAGLSKTVIPTRGIEGMNQWSVYFDNVRVPANNLIGEEHAGAMALFKALNPERILAAASAVGVSEHCLQVACNYARERKVFRGTPIGQYQAVQHPLADVKIRQEAVRLMTYKAAWAFDAGLPPAEAAFYANCAKYLGAELGVMAADASIETLGGNGFSDDYGIAHLWEAMRLLKTAPISKEMILNYVAEHTLDLPRSY